MALFDRSELQAAVEKAFAEKPGKSVVKVSVGLDTSVESYFAVRVGSHVEIGGLFKRTPGTVTNPKASLSGGGQVTFTW